MEAKIHGKLEKVNEKTCLKTCCFLTSIFIDFSCHFALQVEVKVSDFFQLFPKLAPRGAQERPKSAQERPKGVPRAILGSILEPPGTILKPCGLGFASNLRPQKVVTPFRFGIRSRRAGCGVSCRGRRGAGCPVTAGKVRGVLETCSS